MAIQDVLFVVGIVALVIGIGLGVMAFYVFRRDNIPSIIADLTGKSRQLGMVEQNASAERALRARRKTIRDRRFTFGAGGSGREKETPAGFDPDAPTGIIRQEGWNPDDPTSISGDADTATEVQRFDADAPTDIVAVRDKHAEPDLFEEADLPTEVELEDQDMPTNVLIGDGFHEDEEDIDGKTMVLGTGFAVTRSELRINSDVVITLRKED